MKLRAYAKIIGKGEIEELFALSERLSLKSMLHINSTAVGGGVAEILNRLVPLLNDIGIDARWSVMKGGEEFFRVTKSFHNALQGAPVKIGKDTFEIYLKYNRMNAENFSFDRDVTVIHDPQPAALIDMQNNGKWIWRCHIDISTGPRYRPAFELIGVRRYIKKALLSQTRVWKFLKRYIRRYDASMFSAAAFSRAGLNVPQFLVPPSIDPLSDKNRELKEQEIDKVLDKHGISREKPIIAQIGRFDRFKDPMGVIDAYKIVKKRIDCQLILAGGTATDDPEGIEMFQEVKKEAMGDRDIHVIILPPFSDLEVNVFQTAASVVLQKSLKEGFGLTVSEALWKSTPVVGGAVGGIPSQIMNGINGYLIHSTEGAANRIMYLLRNPEHAKRLGQNGREYVKQRFLLTRHLRDYLLIMHSLEHPRESFIQL